MKKLKLVFISTRIAPYQVKLCYALQEYFDAELWFYEGTGGRPSWWNVDLGDKCKVLNGVFYKRNAKYITFNHLKFLNKVQPDIVMLAGFTIPANYLAYLWAKFLNKKIIVFVEVSSKKNRIRGKSFGYKLIKTLYSGIDLVMADKFDAYEQFKYTFNFGSKVVAAYYPADINNYLNHPLRSKKEKYTILFGSRLVEKYNPLFALDVFYEVNKRYKNTILKLNAQGDLREACEKKISELRLQDCVFFLDDIKKWEDIDTIYRETDILIFPAIFSHGNILITECMASGMGIVISNKILGNGRLIVNNYNGFNLELNKESFVNAVISYIENPDLLKKHGSINKELAKERTPENTAKLYYELIMNLFKNNNEK